MTGSSMCWPGLERADDPCAPRRHRRRGLAGPVRPELRRQREDPSGAHRAKHQHRSRQGGINTAHDNAAAKLFRRRERWLKVWPASAFAGGRGGSCMLAGDRRAAPPISGPTPSYIRELSVAMFDHRQWRAAGIPFLPHTVTGPVTGPVNASSSVVVSTGSAPAAARRFRLPSAVSQTISSGRARPAPTPNRQRRWSPGRAWTSG